MIPTTPFGQAIEVGGGFFSGWLGGKEKEKERELTEKYNAPSLAYQQMMLPYAGREMAAKAPYMEAMYPLEQQYQQQYAYPMQQQMATAQMGMMPLTEEYMKQYQIPLQQQMAKTQMGLLPQAEQYMKEQYYPYQEEFVGAQRGILPEAMDYLREPGGVSPEESAQIWGRTRQKIAPAYEAERQRLGERAASQGMLRSGRGWERPMREIGLSQAQTETTAAIDQSIWEATLAREDKARKGQEMLGFARGGQVAAPMPMPQAQNLPMPSTGMQLSPTVPGFPMSSMNVPQAPAQDYSGLGQMAAYLPSMFPQQTQNIIQGGQGGQTFTGGQIPGGTAWSPYPQYSYGMS